MTQSSLSNSGGLRLDRRSLLLGSVGLGLAAAAGGTIVASKPALAASSLNQVPYYYRFRIGELIGTDRKSVV